MPLSVAQKHFIEFILSDFFHLSDNPAQLVKDVGAIKAALTGNVPPEHPYHNLGACFKEPCSHFQGLERNDVAISIGLVQLYILEYLNQHILTAASKILVPLNNLDWNLTELTTQHVPADHLQHPFISFTPTTHVEDWHVVQEPGAMYEYDLEIEMIPGEEILVENDHADMDADSEASSESAIYYTSPAMYLGQVKVKTTLSPDEITLGNTQISIPFEDGEEVTALPELKNIAAIAAKKLALDTAIKYLIAWDIVSPELLNEHDLINAEGLTFTPYETTLLTQRFYFDQLREKKLVLTDLLQITSEQLATLIHPNIISLMQKNLITFHQAKNLSIEKFRVLSTPFYHELTSQQKIPVENILSIQSDQAKILIYPPISNLIQQAKLPFQTALRLPLFSKPLFANPAYMHLFTQHTVDWSQIVNLNESHYKLLINKSVVRAITSGQITFNHILHLPDLTITLLLDQPRLASWLYNGIISTQDIKLRMNRSLLTFYADIYIARINHVRLGTPHSIDSKTDTIENILSEIHLLANEAHLLENILLDKIINGLANLIIDDINNRATSLPVAFLAFMEIIHQDRTFSLSEKSKAILNDLIDKAIEISEAKVNPSTLFRPTKRHKTLTNQEEQGLREFVNQLRLLQPLQDPINQELQKTMGLKI